MSIDDLKGNLEDLIIWAEKELESIQAKTDYSYKVEGMLSAYKEVMEILDGKV